MKRSRIAVLSCFVSYVVWCSALGFASGEDHSTHGTKSAPASRTAAQPSKKGDDRVPIEVPEDQQARMGIKLAQADKRVVEHVIRTVGSVTADQSKEAHVHTRLNGWIEQIFADAIGKAVKKGQPLFDLCRA